MSRFGLTHQEVIEWIEEKCKAKGWDLTRLGQEAKVSRKTLWRHLNTTDYEGERHTRKLATLVSALGGTLKFEYDIIEEP